MNSWLRSSATQAVLLRSSATQAVFLRSPATQAVLLRSSAGASSFAPTEDVYTSDAICGRECVGDPGVKP